MARNKKCTICGEKILTTEPFVPYKGRYAHQHCFDVKMKTLAQEKKATLSAKEEIHNKKKKSKTGPTKKTQAELKDGMSEEDYAKKKKYHQYLRALIDDEPLSVKQLAVSERFIERYNFTFEGMYNTLVYLNEILEKDLKGDIVGIIPYYYTEAAQFYADLETIGESGEEINLKKLYPTKKVYVKPIKKKSKEMSITDIGD